MSIKEAGRAHVQTVLLTGGRAPVTLELARAFHANGQRVLVAESVRYHLCRVSQAVAGSYMVPAPADDPDGFVAALEQLVIREQVDILLPTCEEIFYVARGRERLSAHCLVWAAPLPQLLELHDKWRFVQLAARLGLSVPPTSRLADGQQSLDGALTTEAGNLPIDREWVLKPIFSRFAARVRFVASAQDASRKAALLDQQLTLAFGKAGRRAGSTPRASDWIVQQRIPGRHLSTYSVVWQGELLAHATYPCHYRIGQGATVHYTSLAHEGAVDWVRRLVRAIGFSGQIGFDFIETPAGVLYAIECNPRATSGLHLLTGAGNKQHEVSSVQGSDWVRVFLQPATRRAGELLVPPHDAASGMVAAGMLAAGLAQVRSLQTWRDWRTAWCTARDVVYQPGDWRPLLEQVRQLGQTWQIARKRGIALTEAMTIDIEWNGER